MSAPLLAQALDGNVFFAFISAIAFATILAVVAGLTISASTSFAHDFWTNVIHKGLERRPGEEVMVARISAFVVGAVAIAIASIGVILVSPSLMAIDPPTVTGTARHMIQAKAFFPLENPGISSIPLGFIAAILATLLSHEPTSEHKFNELLVRSNTGLGAEQAGAH